MSSGRDKRLDEMDSLWDMGRFPVAVYVGATANILATISATYGLRRKISSPMGLFLWAAGIISANVIPVVVLRSGMDEGTDYPFIEEMGFFGDQHKFSSWVYALASANMLVWVLFSWTLFAYRSDRKALAAILAVAFVCTFFPAWIRLFRR